MKHTLLMTAMGLTCALTLTNCAKTPDSQTGGEMKKEQTHDAHSHDAHVQDGHAPSKGFKPTTYIPEGGYKTTTDSKLIEPSTAEAANVGDKIADLTKRSFAGTTTQKLTDRSYWLQSGFYNTVFYVGDKGVLLMDPLGDGAGPSVLEAIRSVTDKPITTIVYSHHHGDHIGDANVFVEEAKKNGHELRVVATDKTAQIVKYRKMNVPAPTEVLPFAGGQFDFEGLTVSVKGIQPAAHTGDSALWLMGSEKIAHIPDYVNPNQMPYLNFGGSETYKNFPENLEFIAGQDWEYFSGGHGNIGSKKDFAFMKGYLADLEAATANALETVNPGEYFIPKYNNHQASADAYYKAIYATATDTLRPKYGDFYGFEASVPHQVKMVMEAGE